MRDVVGGMGNGEMIDLSILSVGRLGANLKQLQKQSQNNSYSKDQEQIVNPMFAQVAYLWQDKLSCRS